MVGGKPKPQEGDKNMKRYNEEVAISNELMDTIAGYMDDEKREQVHAELAPCTPEEFLTRYIELDLDFEELLKNEFSIVI